jgi:calreticulin
MMVISHSFICNCSKSNIFPKYTDSYTNTWHTSKHEDKTFGKFEQTAGKFYGDASDKGIKTTQDAHFYALSTTFPEFTNEKKTLVLQFSVKHEQNIDCGGGYIKLFDCNFEPEKMHGETPYLVMFGPDICGPGTKKVHVIFNYDGKNHLINK